MIYQNISNMKYRILLASLVLLTACAEKSQNDLIEQKVDDMLSQMTLEEKVGQLHQISAWGDAASMHDEVAAGRIGSILNFVDPVEINKLQRVAVEESRLGIPLLIARDVIHGYNTILPIPLGQAASFDPELVEQGARMAAVEASADGIRWTFAPMIDISRDARWGRIAESCGEDPYLASVMGVAMVRGFQGDSLNDPTAIAACAKHYAGYGAAEGGRDYNAANIPERQLRNVYLPPFEAVAKAGAQTFMSSFNEIDGVPSTANPFLLNDVLRGEWGFDGFVVTDWNSAGELMAHGVCVDKPDLVEKSINSGVDMDMMTYGFIEELPQLVEEGKVKQSVLDEAVRRVLRVKYHLGLFDNPYVDESLSDKVSLTPENLALARKAAVESVILLKNEGDVLPLGANVKSVAVVGPMAHMKYDQLGTWAFDGVSDRTVTPLEAIREIPGITVNYEPAFESTRDKSTAGIPAAISAARRSDVVIAIVGEEAILSGEAHSLADISLKGAQNELIRQLSATGKPLVMIVMAGRPLTIGEQIEQSDAVLYSFHPGTMGGAAIADLLWGVEAPSGRTPVTFPKMVGQIPIYYNHANTGRPFQGNETLIDDIPLRAGQTSLGCTSFYLDAGVEPLYPFGYGLTYTTFEYGEPRLSANELGVDDTLIVEADITNTGSREATEVAQLYVRDLVGSISRPVRELKAFKRVNIKPGETVTVEFSLPISELAFYGFDYTRKVEPGEFNLWVCHDSNSGTPVSFTVK